MALQFCGNTISFSLFYYLLPTINNNDSLMFNYDKTNGFSISNIFDKRTRTTSLNNDEISKICEQFNTSNLSAKKFCETLNITDSSMKSYLATCGATSASVEGFSQHLNTAVSFLDTAAIKTKLLAAGTKVLNMALGAIGGIVASIAIGKIFEVVDNIINAKQKLEEAATSAKNNIKDIKSEFDNLKSSTSGLIEEYAKLSQGVEQFTGKNISLSSDDYQQFLDDSAKLAQLFPNLTRSYDENGNAIVRLGGNVSDITTKLNQLIEAQQRLAQQKIDENMDDVFKNSLSKLKDYYNNAKDAKERLNNISFDIPDLMLQLTQGKEIDSKMFNTDIGTKLFANINKVFEDEANRHVIRVGDKLKLDVSTDLTEDQKIGIDAKAEDIAEEYQKEIYKAQDKYSSIIRDSKNGIQEELASLQEPLDNWLNLNFNYDAIVSKFGDKMGTAIQSMVSKINWANIADVSDWDDAKQWLNDNLLRVLKDATPEIRQAFQEMFTLEDMPIDQAMNYLDRLQAYFTSQGINIPVFLDMKNGLQETKDEFNNNNVRITRRAYDENQIKGQGEDSQLQNFFKEEGIDTEEEMEAWNTITQGATNATEAINAYKEAKKEANDVKVEPIDVFSEDNNKKIDQFKQDADNISQVIDKINNKTITVTDALQAMEDFDIDPTKIDMTGNFQDLKSVLDEIKQERLDDLIGSFEALRDQGQITEEQFEGIQDALTAVGDQTDYATSGFQSLSEAIGALQDGKDLIYEVGQEAKSSGEISVEELQKIIDKYPELQQVCQDYLDGLASTDDVLRALTQSYNNDLNNYKTYYAYKNQYDTGFYKNVVSHLSEDIKNKAAAYGVDLRNFKNLAQAKARIYNSLVSQMETKYQNAQQYQIPHQSNYYDGSDKFTMSDSFIKQHAKIDASAIGADISAAFTTAINATVSTPKIKVSPSLVDKYNKKNGSGSGKKKKKGSGSKNKNKNKNKKKKNDKNKKKKQGKDKKKKEETPQEYDWVERELKKQEEQIAKDKDRLSDRKSANTDISIYSDLVKDAQTQVQNYKDAKAYYNKLANKVGLDSKYKKLVDDGALSVSTVKDDKLKTKIENYQKWKDKVSECDSSIRSLNKDVESYNKAMDELKTDKLAQTVTYLEQENKQLQNNVDLLKAKGKTVDEKNYRYMIYNNNKKINELKEENKLYKSMQKGLSKYSAEYQDYQSKIDSNNNTISELQRDDYTQRDNIRENRWKKFNEDLDKRNNYSDELSDIKSHINQNNLYDKKGKLTSEGKANIAITDKQIQNETKKIADYRRAIVLIDKELKVGTINQDTYNSELNNYLKLIRESSNNIDDFKNSLIEMQKVKLNKVNDDLKDEIELRKEALQKKKDYYEYNKTLQEKNKDVNALKAQIAALNGATSIFAKARKAQLEAQLSDAKKDLEDTKKEHAFDLMSSGYDKLESNAQTALDKVLDALESNASKQTKVVSDMLNTIKSDYKSAYSEIQKIISDSTISLSSTAKSDIDTLKTSKGASNSVKAATTSPARTSADKSALQVDTNIIRTNATNKSTYFTADKISAKGKITLYVGQTANVNAKTVNANAGITYTTSDSKIATVDGKGNVKGKKKGSCKVTSHCGYKSCTTTIIVKEKPKPKKKKTTKPSTKKTSKTNTKSKTNSKKKTSTKPKVSSIKGTLKKGSKDKSDIKTLQKALNQLKIKDENGRRLAVDGSFGKHTVAALKGFQKRYKVKQTGVLDSATKKAFKIKGYSKGTNKIKSNQFAVTSENGEEIILKANDKGYLSQLTYGSSVIPADISKRIMKMTQSDLPDMINKISAVPNMKNINNVSTYQPITLKVDHFIDVKGSLTQDVMPDLKKLQKTMTKNITNTLVSEMKKIGMK